MKKGAFLLKFSVFMISVWLFLCCDRSNDDFAVNLEENNKKNTAQVRSAVPEIIRVAISNRVVTIEWGLVHNSGTFTGVLFTLKSSLSGYLYSFELTSEDEIEGVTIFELPSWYSFGDSDILTLEYWNGFSARTVITLQKTEDGYNGELLEKKCEHYFYNNPHNYTMNLSANLNSGLIEGSINVVKQRRCKFVMEYRWLDYIKDKWMTGSVTQVLPVDSSRDNVKIYWYGSWELSNYYMSDICCEIRIYDLSCPGVPESTIGFDRTCTNYLCAEFVTKSSSFAIPTNLKEVKEVKEGSINNRGNCIVPW